MILDVFQLMTKNTEKKKYVRKVCYENFHTNLQNYSI